MDMGGWTLLAVLELWVDLPDVGVVDIDRDLRGQGAQPVGTTVGERPRSMKLM